MSRTETDRGDLASRISHAADTVDDDAIEDLVASAVADIGRWSERFGAVRCFAVRWHRSHALSIPGEWHAADRPPLGPTWSIGRRRSAEELRFWVEELSTSGRPAWRWLDDLPAGARGERQLLVADRADAYVHAPIRIGRREFGALAWRLAGADAAPEEVAEAASEFASALTHAFIRLDDIDEFGAQFTRAIASSTDDELLATFHQTLAEIARQLDADRVRLIVDNGDADGERTFTVLAGWERPGQGVAPAFEVAPHVRHPWSTAPSMAAAVASRRMVRIDEAVAAEVTRAERDEWQTSGASEMLLSPVVREGRPDAALVVSRLRDRQPWTDREVVRLRSLTNALDPMIDRYARVHVARGLAARERDRLTDTVRLVGALGHDLRTPLHAIAGYAELLDVSTPDQREYIEGIRTHVAAITERVDDLLDLAHSSPGSTAMLTPVVQEVAAQFQRTLAARRIHLSGEAIPADHVIPVSLSQARPALRDLVGTTLLAVGAGSRIDLVPTTNGLRLVVASTAPIRANALRFPLAAAVLGRGARIEARPVDVGEDGLERHEVAVAFTPID